MKKVTLLTIAEQLNVSKALVSKALSHHPSVSPTTKDVIWKKAEELGYEIRAAKKSVSRANTGNVVMMVPRGYLADSQYWAKVIHGIEEEISKTNFSLIYAGVDMNLPVGEGMPSCIIDRKVDGVFVLGHIPEAYTNILRQWEIPYVLVDSNQQDPEADHVSANNFLGGL